MAAATRIPYTQADEAQQRAEFLAGISVIYLTEEEALAIEARISRAVYDQAVQAGCNFAAWCAANQTARSAS